MASRLGKQLGGLIALALASVIGVAALMAPVPTPPTELPPRQAGQTISPTERHKGVGTESSRIWQPIAALADAVREPLATAAVEPPKPGEPNPGPSRFPLNWRYVGLITITKADGTVVPAAVVRVEGRQRFLTIGDRVPAPGPDEAEVIQITPEHIVVKRGETEDTVILDPDLDLMEQRGFGA